MRLRENVVEMPNSQTTIYGVLECQYRYVSGEAQRWEMPTGGVMPGESVETESLEVAVLRLDEVLALVTASEIRDTPKA